MKLHFDIKHVSVLFPQGYYKSRNLRKWAQTVGDRSGKHNYTEQAILNKSISTYGNFAISHLPKNYLIILQIEQSTNRTGSNSPNLNYTICSLNRFKLTKEHSIHCKLNIILFNWPLYNSKEDDYHNWSKPQWIQVIGVRVVINFYTREESSACEVLVTWPPGHKLVRFEPSNLPHTIFVQSPCVQ